MIAELSIGRRTASDPVGAFKAIAPNSLWKAVGGLGVLTGFMILSFYCVVAGWTLKYVLLTVSGQFVGGNPETIQRTFTTFVADGVSVTIYHLLFMALTVWIVTGGIEKGIEKSQQNSHADAAVAAGPSGPPFPDPARRLTGNPFLSQP